LATDDCIEPMTLALFYINLARRADRRHFMERQFVARRLTAERVEAFVPEAVPVASLARWTDPVHPRHVSPPELACTFSHRKAWRLIVDRGLPAACILEDDAWLSPAFAGMIEASPDLGGFEIVKIEQRSAPATIGRQAGALLPGIGLHRPYSFAPGSCGYLISQAGARTLLARSVALDMPVDNILFNPDGKIFHRLAVAQAVPGLVVPADRLRQEGTVADSDIVDAWHRRTQERTVIPAPDPRLRASLLRRGDEDGATMTVVRLAD
jgi:glycosyl transferase, family 25